MQSPRFQKVLLPLSVFAPLFALRLCGGSPWWNLTFDSVFYAQAANRIADGEIVAAIGSIWMPLIGWSAAPLIMLGLAPAHAILFLNFLAAAGLIAILFRFLKREFGSHTATLAALLFATDPLFVEQASTIGSDTLYLLLATLILVRSLNSRSPTAVDAFLLPLLVLCRIPGLLVSVFVIGRWRVNAFRSRDGKVRILLAVLPFIFTVLALCLYFQKKIGLFVPSPSYALNKFYLGLEWLRQDTARWCNLFDGHHTVLGDLNQLESPLPSAPEIPLAIRVRYRLMATAQYLGGWMRVVTLPIFLLAGAGLFIRRKDKMTPWLALWCFANTVGMAFTTYVPRYFLPTLPVYYLFLAVTLHHFRDSRRLTALVLICIATNGVVTASHLAWGHILRPRAIHSAGKQLFQRIGAHHRIATVENFVSAVQSRGKWKYLPCASSLDMGRYLNEQNIEYLVLPIGFAEKSLAVRQLETNRNIKIEFEDTGDRVYRVLGKR